MPRNPFPSYDQYPKDFLTSENVVAMSMEAECAYRRLLDWAWLSDPPCTIPMDDAVLADLSKAKDRWPAIRDSVLRMFDEIGGRLRNKKQWQIFREKSAFFRQRKQAGKRGGQKSAELRRNRASAASFSLEANGQAKSNPPSSSSSSSPKKETTRMSDELFERAWGLYPKRTPDNPKAKARRAWNGRVAEGVDPAAMIAGAERYARYVRAKGDEGTPYVKLAATFFGPDRSFENEWTLPTGNGKPQPQQLPGINPNVLSRQSCGCEVVRTPEGRKTLPCKRHLDRATEVRA